MKELNIQIGRINKMKVYLEDDGAFFNKHQGLLEKAQKVMLKCIELEKVPYDVEISLTVVTKEEIQEINRDYREIDRSTDVLSFPQIENNEQGCIDWQEIDENSYINLDTKLFILGDIVLCDEVAKEQAISYGHSLEREVCFLIAHSMFHLLGYDHITEQEEKVMFTKQEQVLGALGILR